MCDREYRSKVQLLLSKVNSSAMANNVLGSKKKVHNMNVSKSFPPTRSPFSVLSTFGDCYGVYIAGTFNIPTSYQQWVWEREAHSNWSMVICQGSTRSELT